MAALPLPRGERNSELQRRWPLLLRVHPVYSSGSLVDRLRCAESTGTALRLRSLGIGGRLGACRSVGRFEPQLP